MIQEEENYRKFNRNLMKQQRSHENLALYINVILGKFVLVLPTPPHPTQRFIE
jgi:hypothetical protein